MYGLYSNRYDWSLMSAPNRLYTYRKFYKIELAYTRGTLQEWVSCPFVFEVTASLSLNPTLVLCTNSLMHIIVFFFSFFFFVVFYAATAQLWPWPLQSSTSRIFFLFRGFGWSFVTNMCYWVGLFAPRLTPNLEDQSIPFCLGHHLWPVWRGRPY